jgi:hypothetical protein
MSDFKVIYWKQLKKDDVCLREFETIEQVNEFIKENGDQFHGYLVAEKRKTGKNGVHHYTVLNRGFYKNFKVIIDTIVITVMVAIIVAFFYYRR